MNRVDRLFAILLKLQEHGRLRAEDLAEFFEVSKRTIYRDIRALSESGVPIVSLPGEGIEWAPFQLAEGVDEADLVAAADALQSEFLACEIGLCRCPGDDCRP